MVRVATTRFCVRVGSPDGNGELKSATSSRTPAAVASSVVKGAFAATVLIVTLRSADVMAAIT